MNDDLQADSIRVLRLATHREDGVFLGREVPLIMDFDRGMKALQNLRDLDFVKLVEPGGVATPFHVITDAGRAFLADSMTLARDLKAGTRVRTKSGFEMIESIEPDPSAMITGGRHMKSAVALKIVLHGGAVHYVHPGDRFHAE